MSVVLRLAAEQTMKLLLERQRRMKTTVLMAGLAASTLLFSLSAAEHPAVQDGTYGQPLYVSGQDGYRTYRIPALAVTTQGTLLAFCEGRKNSASDTGDIDLLVKRSTDHGRTWSPQQLVWDDAGNTCGNPCAVVERETGTIWLLMTWNRGDDRESQIIAQTSKDTRRVFVTHSTDDGLNWSDPREITADARAAWSSPAIISRPGRKATTPTSSIPTTKASAGNWAVRRPNTRSTSARPWNLPAAD